MRTLTVTWQRLLDDEERTCQRCGQTERALEEAVTLLKRSLEILGINVVLEKYALSLGEFRRDPLESNRIWIAGIPLETWLNATVGQSACCSPCGENQCRTVTIGGTTHEAIPKELILKAGLLAAAHLL